MGLFSAVVDIFRWCFIRFLIVVWVSPMYCLLQIVHSNR